jgi:uncharacterized protein (DUF433 family)
MIEPSNGQSTVVRTERGLSIVGTRLTLYAIMDYLRAGWPVQLIQDWLNLTSEQMAGVLAYLDTHREEVEIEYQHVVRQAEETRHYWENRSLDRHANRPDTSCSPEQAALLSRLRAWQDKLKPS